MRKQIAAACLLAGGAIIGVPAVAGAAPVSYANCTDVWETIGRPIYQGEPGYAAKLDSDHDGVGCETKPAGATAKVPAAPRGTVSTGTHNGSLAETGSTLTYGIVGGLLLASGAGVAFVSRRQMPGRHRAA